MSYQSRESPVVLHSMASQSEVRLRVEEVRKVYPTYNELLQLVFSVGKLYSTFDEDENPAESLGFGTWVKVSPGAVTWGQLANTTWNMTGTTEGIYVWQRTE